MRLIKNPLKNIYLTISSLSISKKNWHVKKRAIFPPEFWDHIHCPRSAPLGCSKGNTTAVGRATTEDIKTGWAGHLTTREMQDRWTRFSGVPVGNHLDNHRKKLFNLQWSRTWQLRALKGWTPLAAIDLDLHEQHDYCDDDVDNFDGPHWWTLSQLG
jgi:hypothetical protein